MYYLIIIGLIIISHIILHNMVVRMIKYQNFKNNVSIRVALSEMFKEFEHYETEMHTIDDADWIKIGAEKKDDTLNKIKEKVNHAIDEELDNDSSWKETISAINIEQRFNHVDNSYPFYQIFDSEMVKRHNERNKEAIKREEERKKK